MNLMDHTGQFWATGFNEVAETIMGISANDLQGVRDSGDDAKFNSYFQNIIGRTFTFQMMAKQDSYNVSDGPCKRLYEALTVYRTKQEYDTTVVKPLHRTLSLIPPISSR